jgi:hypothetical protein
MSEAIEGSSMSSPPLSPEEKRGIETWEIRRLRSVLPQLAHLPFTGEFIDRTMTLTRAPQLLQENSYVGIVSIL